MKGVLANFMFWYFCSSCSSYLLKKGAGEEAFFITSLSASCCLVFSTFLSNAWGMLGCSCLMFAHMSPTASVTHLNLGLPARLFGGFQGTQLLSGLGPMVMCLTGCSFGMLCIRDNRVILLFR